MTALGPRPKSEHRQGYGDNDRGSSGMSQLAKDAASAADGSARLFYKMTLAFQHNADKQRITDDVSRLCLMNGRWRP